MNDPSDVTGRREFRRAAPGGLVPWALAAACVLLAAGGEPVREMLRFDRAAVGAGEVWRLATAHCVHLGWAHALLNAAALAAVALLFADVLSRRDWLAGSLISAAAIDAGLYWLEPGLDWYVGLSGVLHGLVLIGSLRLLAVQPALGLAVAAGVAVKLGWEALGGPSPWAEVTVEGPVVVEAHRYGVAGAGLYLVAERVRRICFESL